NVFGAAGQHSRRMPWSERVAADPDVIIVAPCGYQLARCREELALLEQKSGWATLTAVNAGRVYFADGNAYFNPPGPRPPDRGEMLSHIPPGARHPPPPPAPPRLTPS